MYTKARKLRPGLLDCNTQSNIEENLMRLQDDYGYEDEDGIHPGEAEFTIGKKLTDADKGKVLGVDDDLNITPPAVLPATTKPTKPSKSKSTPPTSKLPKAVQTALAS